MYCEKCGALMEEEAEFCQNCGEKIETSNIRSSGNAEDQNSANNAEKAKTSTKLKTINKKGIIICAAILLVVILAISIISVISNRISVEKYIHADNITVSGFNGFGKIESDASDVIDKDALDSCLGSKKSSNESDLDDFDDDFFGDLYEADSFSDIHDYVDAEFAEDYNNISNGDTIVININVDYQKINSLGYSKKLVGDETFTVEYTVSGLSEIATVDPFHSIKKVYIDTTQDYIQLFFDFSSQDDITAAGYSLITDKNGTCKYYSKSESDDYEKLMFEINYSTDSILDNIKSNDKITLNASASEELGEYGIQLSTYEKEYTVDKISYLKDESKITTDVIKNMKNKIEEKSESTVVSQYFYSSRDWESEKIAFSSVIFLVKGSNGYETYEYPADTIKISEQGDIVVDYENYSQAYGIYGKIKDFEDSHTSEDSSLKKIEMDK